VAFARPARANEPRLIILILLVGGLAFLSAAGCFLPGGQTLVGMGIFCTIGCWGAYASYAGRMGEWLCAAAFLGGCETVFRTSFGHGYLLYYYWLILCLFVRPQCFTALLRNPEIGLACLLLLVLLMVANLLQPASTEKGRWWIMIFTGVLCGCLLAAEVPSRALERAGLSFLAGTSLVAFFLLLGSRTGTGDRLSVQWEGPGPTALACGFAVFLGIDYAARWRGTRMLIVAGMALLCLVALIETASRGVSAGLCAILILWCLLQRPFTKGLVILGAMVTIAFVGLAANPRIAATLVDRWTKTAEHKAERGIYDIREEMFQAALNGTLQRPLFGWGTGAYSRTIGSFFGGSSERLRDTLFSDAHNTLVHIAYEQGLAGAGLLIVFWVFLVRRAWSLSQASRFPAFALVIFSLLLGLITMHKQAPMFVPWFLALARYSGNRLPAGLRRTAMATRAARTLRGVGVS
jgi:hypothetical protein